MTLFTITPLHIWNMCEKVKAKQISLCWWERGGLQQEVYATKKVLESRVSSFQGGGWEGGTQQRQCKFGLSQYVHPQVPGAQEYRRGPCSLKFNDGPNPPSPFKIHFCVSQGASQCTKYVCTFIMDLNGCCTCAYLTLTRPLREIAKSQWWQVSSAVTGC